jgi:hypothetical protein
MRQTANPRLRRVFGANGSPVNRCITSTTAPSRVALTTSPRPRSTLIPARPDPPILYSTGARASVTAI